MGRRKREESESSSDSSETEDSSNSSSSSEEEIKKSKKTKKRKHSEKKSKRGSDSDNDDLRAKKKRKQKEQDSPDNEIVEKAQKSSPECSFKEKEKKARESSDRYKTAEKDIANKSDDRRREDRERNNSRPDRDRNEVQERDRYKERERRPDDRNRERRHYDHRPDRNVDYRRERDDRGRRDDRYFRNEDRRGNRNSSPADRRDDNRTGRNDRNRRKRSRSGSFDHKNARWGKDDDSAVKREKKEPVDKQKPNFALSGKLTEETNTYRGVVIKYSEPPEARKPKRRWRLYPFKGEKAMQTLYIHRESAYLIGRDRKVVDLPVDHPSCSKQHAVLQYRLVPFTREDGSSGKRVRPYLIDLDSANGTYINNKRIDSKKYVELLEKDVIKFGYSSREYVLLHENSKDEAQDDDVKDEEVTVKEERE